MDGFRFRFERVLDVKRALEERVQSEVANWERLLSQAREEVAALAERLFEREEQLRGLDQGVIPIERTILLLDYAAHLKKRISEGESRISACERELAAAKEALILAVKERKTLERLRERDLAAYREELARREQKEMDEMAQQVAARGVGRKT